MLYIDVLTDVKVALINRVGYAAFYKVYNNYPFPEVQSYLDELVPSREVKPLVELFAVYCGESANSRLMHIECPLEIVEYAGLLLRWLESYKSA